MELNTKVLCSHHVNFQSLDHFLDFSQNAFSSFHCKTSLNLLDWENLNFGMSDNQMLISESTALREWLRNTWYLLRDRKFSVCILKYNKTFSEPPPRPLSNIWFRVKIGDICMPVVPGEPNVFTNVCPCSDSRCVLTDAGIHPITVPRKAGLQLREVHDYIFWGKGVGWAHISVWNKNNNFTFRRLDVRMSHFLGLNMV